MGGMTCSPLAGGWLSGKYRKGQEVSGPRSAARSRRLPARYEASAQSNAAKLDAAGALGALAGETGITLIQMAVAFVTRHPAVTSARRHWGPHSAAGRAASHGMGPFRRALAARHGPGAPGPRRDRDRHPSRS